MSEMERDEWVEDETGRFVWPFCTVEGCENRICRGISDRYCFPHAPGNEHVKRMKIDAQRGTPLSELASHSP
jgi:hypothetical protein